jgi:hypothetical protein
MTALRQEEFAGKCTSDVFTNNLASKITPEMIEERVLGQELFLAYSSGKSLQVRNICRVET